MLKKILSTLLVLVLLFGLGIPTTAVLAEDSSKPAAASRFPQLSPAAKMAPELVNAPDGQPQKALVYLNEQVNAEQVAAQAISAAISRSVPAGELKLVGRVALIRALQETAQRTQLGLLRFLEEKKAAGAVQSYQSFWISNLVIVSTGKATLEIIAARPEVAKIAPSKTVTLDDVLPTATPETADTPVLNEIGWNISMVRAPEVWAMGFTGQGVVVCNIDTGVDWTHPALSRKWLAYNPLNPIVPDPALLPYAWFDATVDQSPVPVDTNGHGTHTMGTMVCSDPQGGHQYGVAPEASWIAADAFTTKTGTDEDLLECGQWVLAPGGDPSRAPDVVSNSWGSSEGSDTWYQATVQAWRAAGIFPSWSIGNSGPAPGSAGEPGAYPESFSSGAVNQSSALASFSSRGPSFWGEIKPEVVAPGVGNPSTIPGGGYSSGYSGTSMACPHSSGAAALLLNIDPTLTPTDIENLLMATAAPKTSPEYPESPNNGFGYGLLDIYSAALQLVEHSGNTWIDRTPSIPTSPSARCDHAMVYDSARGKVILFGGHSGGYHNDTWSYDPVANSWTNLNPANPPATRRGHAMVYDATRGKAILFGGSNGSTIFNDTWSYDPVANSWTNLNPANPPSIRTDNAMAYDSARGKVILFGGNTSGPPNNTWSYDPVANAWTNLNPAGAPSGRFDHAMVYDVAQGKVILFGGYSNGSIFNDTWSYDPVANTWINFYPSNPPSPRASPAMVYDSSRGKVVLFGGLGSNDTWAYDPVANAWANLNPCNPPSARYDHAMVYDAVGGKVILFGGYSGSSLLNDTWAYDDGGGGASSLFLDPPTQDVGSPQGDVVVTLKVGNTQSINSIFAALTWDPSKLSLKTSVGNQGVELGSLFSSGMSMPVPSSGRLDLTVGLTGGTVNGPGEVAKIHFTVASGLPPGAAIPISFASSPLATITLGNGATLNPTTTGCSLKVLSGEKVWPGDANNDGVVNGLDFTKVFLYWGKTGQGRTNASNQWREEICPNATPAWSPKEALWSDCNGDGIINGLDFSVIFLNWGKTHP